MKMKKERRETRKACAMEAKGRAACRSECELRKILWNTKLQIDGH